MIKIVAAVLPLLLLASGCAEREEGGSARVLTVAVAANFVGTFDALVERFRQRRPDITVRRSAGSTGALYAQVANGAPFDLFLAADQARPERLVKEGRATADGCITYAVGRLALISAPGNPPVAMSDLTGDGIRTVAIANPVTAPYGAAAMEVLEREGMAKTLEPRLVRGNDVAQTLQFVATGAADVGFVALSQALGHPELAHVVIPDHLHRPVAQDAVLLVESDEGQAFLRFLTSPEAATIVTSRGYGQRRD